MLLSDHKELKHICGENVFMPLYKKKSFKFSVWTCQTEKLLTGTLNGSMLNMYTYMYRHVHVHV